MSAQSTAFGLPKQMLSRTWYSHLLLRSMCKVADMKFQAGKYHVEGAQRKRLKKILKDTQHPGLQDIQDYEDFRQLPLTRYAEWQDDVMNWRSGRSPLTKSDLVRFQPTSGSSAQIKFIPYTKAFLDELDQAIAPWLSSMYRKSSALAKGKHYWSVSWLPESQRALVKEDNLNDDSALLSFGKRLITQFTQAVPQHVSFAGNPDDAMFATLCYLVATEDLALISVWSPTFALQLIERLNEQAEDVVKVLISGMWGKRDASLENVDAPLAPNRAKLLMQMIDEGEIDLARLWPQLQLISSWDTSGAKQWAKLLQQEVPNSSFEGKGLWATEGVVTIPYQGKYPLAYKSHFYEFEYLQGEQVGQIVPSWELEVGDYVSPIISGGNGLLRYCLDDHLKVIEFWGNVPCFEFQGRRFGVDLVGEKLSPDVATQLLGKINQQFAVKAISLLAVETHQTNTHPFYAILIETLNSDVDQSQGTHDSANTMDSTVQSQADWIDRQLRQHFHYELARDLKQLDAPQIILVEDGWQGYKDLVMREGMIEGNIKPEPLKKISIDSFNAFINKQNQLKPKSNAPSAKKSIKG